MRGIVLALVLGVSSALAASDFRIVLVPDTHPLAASDFDSVGSWIKTNAVSSNIVAVIGLGDLVATDGSSVAQWNPTTNLWYQTAPTVPSLPILGNHDTDVQTNRSATNWNAFYPQSYFTNQPSWSGGFYDATKSENWYWRHTMPDAKNWLVFGLELGPRDVVLNWVSNTIAAFPTDKVMITTHAYIREQGWQSGTDPANDLWNPTTYYADANDGKMMWNKSFRTYSNLFLVVNGHYFDYDDVQIRRSIAIGDNGNHVMQSMVNLQACCGPGWIRILTFHPDSNTCSATTFRPPTGEYKTNDTWQFTFTVFDTNKVTWPVAFGLNDPVFLQSAQPTPTPSTNGLVSYWTLDETSGTRADAMGFNPMSAVNSPGNTTGVITNAATFVSASSQYLTHADNDSLSPGNNDFTVACWAKFNTIGAIRHPLIAKWNSAPNAEEFMLTYHTDGFLHFYVSPDGSAAPTVNSSTNIVTNVWYYVIGWYNSVAKTINIQVNNGAPVSVSHTTGVTNSTLPFDIGGRSLSSIYANAIIDEVGFWKRILTAQERTNLWNGGSGIPFYAVPR